MSAAIALAERVTGGGQQELDDYLSFLKGGCSKYPLDLLRGAGVDMEQPQAVDTALGYFERLVERVGRVAVVMEAAAVDEVCEHARCHCLGSVRPAATRSHAMQLGLVTYQWGADWDLPTLIKNCEKTGFRGVELRTTHKHGVEPSLDEAAAQGSRQAVCR